MAEERCAAQLRDELLRQAEALGRHALLGPEIQTLDSWLAQAAGIALPVLNQPARELVLADALRHAAGVYSDTDPWLLAGQLLTLFDELTRNDLDIPAQLEQFESRLADCYAVTEPSPALQQEAWILHTLWHAWRKQLADEQLSDPPSAHRQRLLDSLEQVGEQHLWLIGFTDFSPLESHWLHTLLARGQAHLLMHGAAQHDGYHPDRPLHDILAQLDMEAAAPARDHSDPLDDFIVTLFDDTAGNLQQRACDFASRHAADAVSQRLKTFCADSPEQEAQAVALQVRRWLLDDIQPVAIITEDRRLARRVRAMLEASHIALDDTGGWALSTTSAAAMLERWLETVEEDFACGPLLDVLKSPFISFGERDAHLARVRRLEQDIILHENIARGLQRYRHHLERRAARLPDWSEPMQRALQQMLNRLDHAASPLLPLLQDTHPALAYLTALHDSLNELGALPCLAEDAAGQRLLEALEELQQAAGYSAVPLAWSEFRNWLGRSLEQTSFRLPRSGSAVCLLTLEQSRLQRFAASVIAGCNREHLPGSPPAHTFFNQRVRAQLGLPTWSQSVARKLHHFCRVLHGAPRVLLTRHAERDAEPVAVSPWLELLETFHHSAWQQSLEDMELHRLVVQPQAQPASPDSARLPDGATRPAPPAPPALQPASWTAYTHQRLIDCPYRYFAADALKLKPREEISEALSKSDYGALVHRIVQAFHSDVARLPGPWSGPLDDSQRDPALALLTRISDVVFREAIEDNFQARSWLQQWRSVLPAYLDWEIGRQRDWQLRSVELRAERALETGLSIHGRIDRVDQRGGGVAVVDYKTGKPPARDAVLAGEAVQLSSYALMLETPVTQLDYLEIGRDQAKQHTCAGDEELQQLLPAIEQRLRQLHRDLQQQAALPAWGDENVCGYCEFSGVCRRDMWVHDDV